MASEDSDEDLEELDHTLVNLKQRRGCAEPWLGGWVVGVAGLGAWVVDGFVEGMYYWPWVCPLQVMLFIFVIFWALLK